MPAVLLSDALGRKVLLIEGKAGVIMPKPPVDMTVSPLVALLIAVMSAVVVLRMTVVMFRNGADEGADGKMMPPPPVEPTVWPLVALDKTVLSVYVVLMMITGGTTVALDEGIEDGGAVGKMMPELPVAPLIIPLVALDHSESWELFQ